MKRILLSLSVAALVSAAGVSLAQNYDNTAPTSPNGTGAPNTLQTGSPSMTSPGAPSAPGATSGTVVLLEKGEGWTSDDTSASPIEILINGQNTQVSQQTPGQVNIVRGTSPQSLRIEVKSPDGKRMERCAKVEVVGSKGESKSEASTETVSQVFLTISKKEDKLVCDKARVLVGSTGSGSGYNM